MPLLFTDARSKFTSLRMGDSDSYESLEASLSPQQQLGGQSQSQSEGENGDDAETDEEEGRRRAQRAAEARERAQASIAALAARSARFLPTPSPVLPPSADTNHAFDDRGCVPHSPQLLGRDQQQEQQQQQQRQTHHQNRHLSSLLASGDSARAFRRLQETLLCPICGEVFTSPVTLCGGRRNGNNNECRGHTFCSVCLARALKLNPGICPTCKGSFDPATDRSANLSLGEACAAFASLKDALRRDQRNIAEAGATAATRGGRRRQHEELLGRHGGASPTRTPFSGAERLESDARGGSIGPQKRNARSAGLTADPFEDDFRESAPRAAPPREVAVTMTQFARQSTKRRKARDFAARAGAVVVDLSATPAAGSRTVWSVRDSSDESADGQLPSQRSPSDSSAGVEHGAVDEERHDIPMDEDTERSDAPAKSSLHLFLDESSEDSIAGVDAASASLEEDSLETNCPVTDISPARTRKRAAPQGADSLLVFDEDSRSSDFVSEPHDARSRGRNDKGSSHNESSSTRAAAARNLRVPSPGVATKSTLHPARATCPVCSVTIPADLLNIHLDGCLVSRKEAKKRKKERRATTTRDFTKHRLERAEEEVRRLPLYAYQPSVLADSALRRLLREHGLSTRGTRPILVARHKEFVNRFNANLDAGPAQRRPVREIVLQVNRQFEVMMSDA